MDDWYVYAHNICWCYQTRKWLNYWHSSDVLLMIKQLLMKRLKRNWFSKGLKENICNWCWKIWNSAYFLKLKFFAWRCCLLLCESINCIQNIVQHQNHKPSKRSFKSSSIKIPIEIYITIPRSPHQKTIKLVDSSTYTHKLPWCSSPKYWHIIDTCLHHVLTEVYLKVNNFSEHQHEQASYWCIHV